MRACQLNVDALSINESIRLKESNANSEKVQ